MKKLVLATALSLVSSFAAAVAQPLQQQVFPTTQQITFTGVFEELFKFLGPRGADFLVAFGVVFAAIWIGLSLVPQLSKYDTNRGALVMFAAMVGLGTAFYIYQQNIPFLALLGPFALFVFFALFALLIVRVILAAREKELEGPLLWASVAFAILIAGIGMLFVPALSGFGVLAIIIGIIILIGAGAVWLGKGKGFLKPKLKPGEAEKPEEIAAKEKEELAREMREEAKEEETRQKLEDDIRRLKSQIRRLATGGAPGTAVDFVDKLVRDILGRIVQGQQLARYATGVTRQHITDTENWLRQLVAAHPSAVPPGAPVAQLEANLRTKEQEKETVEEGILRAYQVISWHLKAAETDIETRKWQDAFASVSLAERQINNIKILEKHIEALNKTIEEITTKLSQVGVAAAPEKAEIKKELNALIKLVEKDIYVLGLINRLINKYAPGAGALPPASAKIAINDVKLILRDLRIVQVAAGREEELMAKLLANLNKITQLGIPLPAPGGALSLMQRVEALEKGETTIMREISYLETEVVQAEEVAMAAVAGKKGKKAIPKLEMEWKTIQNYIIRIRAYLIAEEKTLVMLKDLVRTL